MLKASHWALSISTLLAIAACSSTTREKSTGTNWVTCNKDADCSAYPGARCSADQVCVDASGKPIENTTGTGGTTGADAATGGAPASGGNGGGPGTIAVDCYSPQQNVSNAYEPGAIGCECPAGTPGICVSGVALLCQDGRWVAVEDGPCWGCWTPDEPDLAFNRPSDGCACTADAGSVCIHSVVNGAVSLTGYGLAACTGGKWTLDVSAGQCQCTSDASCGFSSRCDNGTCLAGACEVNGVRYAPGVTGIPSPFDCNTCECRPDGTLTCTTLPCPTPPVCPDGTTAASVCIACGPLGECDIGRTGCLPRCEIADDCAMTYTPVCDPTQKACSAGPCH